jgi:hypothetical protein
VLSGQFLIDSEASLKSTFDRLGSSPATGSDATQPDSAATAEQARP